MPRNYGTNRTKHVNVDEPLNKNSVVVTIHLLLFIAFIYHHYSYGGHLTVLD